MCFRDTGLWAREPRFGQAVEFVTLDVSTWIANTGDDDLDWPLASPEVEVDGKSASVKHHISWSHIAKQTWKWLNSRSTRKLLPFLPGVRLALLSMPWIFPRWTREFRVDGIPHLAFVLPDRLGRWFIFCLVPRCIKSIDVERDRKGLKDLERVI